jgi:hypothetical protein
MARVRRTLILALLAIFAVQVLFVRWMLQGEPQAGQAMLPPPSLRPTRAPDAHVHRGFDLFTQEVKKVTFTPCLRLCPSRLQDVR